MATENNVLAATANGICTITVNRPDKLNALNMATIADIGKAVEAAVANEQVKVIILTGSGTKAFVAGADISEFSNYSESEGAGLAKHGHDVFGSIENCRKPVIAAINGFALGGGCELAMSCHLRVAATNAKFGQPEVNLGLIPGYGGTQRLTALVGKGKAMELCMTSHMADANEALAMGLVNHVTTLDSLLDRTKEILNIIQTKSPMAIAKVITCINRAGYDNGYETEIKEFGDCFGTAEMKEGVSAFMEKRKANF